MDIAYVELDYHLECLNSFCKMFEHKNDSVTVYTLRPMYDEIRFKAYVSKIKWVLCDTDNASFLKKNSNAINTHDVIFIATAANSVIDYSVVDFLKPTLLRVHNGNFYFNKWANVAFPLNLSDLLEGLRFYLHKVLLLQYFFRLNALLEKVPNITFTSDVQTAVFKPLLANRRVFIYPPLSLFVFYGQDVVASDNDYFTIVVPGSVDVRRRDYLLLLKSIRNIKDKTNKKIHIVLLGKIVGRKGKEVAHAFKNITNNNIKITTFNSEVDESYYQQVMLRSDLIVCPLKSSFNNYFINEKVGFTKSSGSVHDIFRYGKKALIPQFYPVDDVSVIEKYNTLTDFSEKLLRFINQSDESAVDYRQEFEKYNTEQMYIKTMDIFTQLINQSANKVNTQ